MEVHQKIKIELPYDIAKKKQKKSNNSKRYMHPNVHWNIIYNSQDMEAI